MHIGHQWIVRLVWQSKNTLFFIWHFLCILSYFCLITRDYVLCPVSIVIWHFQCILSSFCLNAWDKGPPCASSCFIYEQCDFLLISRSWNGWRKCYYIPGCSLWMHWRLAWTIATWNLQGQVCIDSNQIVGNLFFIFAC